MTAALQNFTAPCVSFNLRAAAGWECLSSLEDNHRKLPQQLIKTRD